MITTPSLRRMEPIALEAMVDQAELLTRVDRKYLLPRADLEVFLLAAGADLRVLEIDGRRHFGYRSVYFDTPELAGYLSTARRRRRRFKIRTRSYLDHGLHLLEIKTRGPRGTTVKQRLPYLGDGRDLDPSDRASVQAWLAEFGVTVAGSELRPSLITRYERSTVLMPSAGSRVTIDAAVRWTLPDGTPAALDPDHVVVETKTPRSRSSIDRALWSLGHRPLSLSKYGVGLAALRPELPANRWRSVLRRAFELPTVPRLQGVLR